MSYEVTLTVSRVKEEHVQWTVMFLNCLSDALRLEGTDLGIDLSVEKDKDGVERVHQYLPGAA